MVIASVGHYRYHITDALHRNAEIGVGVYLYVVGAYGELAAFGNDKHLYASLIGSYVVL